MFVAAFWFRMVEECDPKFSQVPMSKPFLRDPEYSHTGLMCPCRPFIDFFCCFFFRPIFGFCVLGEYLGLKGPHIFAGKKTHIRKELGRATLNTCAKFQGLTLKNGVDIRRFVR